MGYDTGIYWDIETNMSNGGIVGQKQPYDM
jgi:hypothetical protein